MTTGAIHVRREGLEFVKGSQTAHETSHPVPWECDAACGTATSAIGGGRNRAPPTPAEQNLAANPAAAADNESTVHTCVSFPEFSGPLSFQIGAALEVRRMVP